MIWYSLAFTSFITLFDRLSATGLTGRSFFLLHCTGDSLFYLKCKRSVQIEHVCIRLMLTKTKFRLPILLSKMI